MNSMRKLTIGARLGLTSSAVLFLIVLLGIFGAYQTHQANFYAWDIGANWMPRVKILGDMRASLNRARRASLQALQTQPGEDAQACIAQLCDSHATVGGNDGWESFQPTRAHRIIPTSGHDEPPFRHSS